LMTGPGGRSTSTIRRLAANFGRGLRELKAVDDFVHTKAPSFNTFQ
jgi:hypothetical protein